MTKKPLHESVDEYMRYVEATELRVLKGELTRKQGGAEADRLRQAYSELMRGPGAKKKAKARKKGA